MEGIKARVKIKYSEGADIAYLYSREALNSLGLVADSFDENQTFLNVGAIISIGKERFKVVRILTKFHTETYNPNPKYGVDIYGVDDMQPFNFQITYEVEPV